MLSPYNSASNSSRMLMSAMESASLPYTQVNNTVSREDLVHLSTRDLPETTLNS